MAHAIFLTRSIMVDTLAPIKAGSQMAAPTSAHTVSHSHTLSIATLAERISGLTASGNEALGTCGTNEWCCDTNRPELSGGQNCCDTNSPKFSLDSRKVENNGTSSDNSNSSNESPSSTEESTTSTTSTSSTSKTTKTTGSQSQKTDGSTSVVLVTSVVNQGSSTIVTSVTGAAATNPPPSETSTPSHKSLAPIIAPTVAVPIAVLLLAGLALAWFLRRRKRQRALSAESPSGPDPVPMYKDPYSPNTDSSYSPGKSELEGSKPDLTHTPVSPRTPSGLRIFEGPNDVGSAGTTGVGGGQRGSSNLSHVEHAGAQPGMAELEGDGGREGEKRRSELPAEVKRAKEGPWLFSDDTQGASGG
ncbi:uncharacterized protein KY384_006757 [Bacidia gigantensis]|uniref:uncharacterized protein n=1 Tax=Bacidia gigantensis TaxID=2732470 RepID=UPI001D040210|nr:uncharacterized protein KY384_006757 [Bacidia gigantensis]KAG8527841.1 hypothetical protein KY384_006757 [Bacidia gigantensis]